MASFSAIVDALPGETFASINRSTIPLLDYWREPGPRLDQLGGTLGVALVDAKLTFEHEQPVAAGRGKASYTDLMIIATTCAVAIEAKYTEPPYPTVRDWLGKQPSANRIAVLGGWLSCIEGATGRRLEASDVAGLPYQLIHRTASVCCIDRPTRHVVYQMFDPAHLGYYEGILTDLRKLLRERAAFGLSVLSTPATLMPGVMSSLPASGDEQAIRAWMRGRPIYTFDTSRARHGVTD